MKPIYKFILAVLFVVILFLIWILIEKMWLALLLTAALIYIAWLSYELKNAPVQYEPLDSKYLNEDK